MYNKQLAEKYDMIYKDKDYSGECDFIERAVEKFGVISVGSILDVGCGTGNHVSILTKRGHNVWGEDFSSAMIEVAKKKRGMFYCPHIPQEKERDFDLCISMFHVVNAINDLKSLSEYFKYVSTMLKNSGLFIFDCWNHHAVSIDPPKPSEKRNDGVPSFQLTSEPIFDWFESAVTLKNKYTETSYSNPPCSFTYYLDITVWQNKVYLDLLRLNGFEVIRICKPFEVNTRAEKNDYKIVYICMKEEE